MAYQNAVRSAEGNPEKEAILKQLIRKYQGRITYLCFNYTKDWDDAREMAQETFIKAYRGLDGFEGRSHYMTWITRIAINQCLTFLAARGRERLGMLNFMHDRDGEERDEGSHRETSRVTAGELMRMADPVTRRVLGLAMHQGLSHSQIAATLGVSRVAITRRITRFKKKALVKVSCA